jgi:hypothetical protein
MAANLVAWEVPDRHVDEPPLNLQQFPLATR